MKNSGIWKITDNSGLIFTFHNQLAEKLYGTISEDDIRKIIGAIALVFLENGYWISQNKKEGKLFRAIQKLSKQKDKKEAVRKFLDTGY